MRILYFSQFYKPENIAASFRATEHSRIWVRESHDVTVFTGWPNYPVGRLFDGYEMKPLVEELIELESFGPRQRFSQTQALRSE